MLQEFYSKIATYILENFGDNFIFFTILLTTTASIIYFIMISYIITQMDKRFFVRKNDLSQKDPCDDANQKHRLSTMNSGIKNYVLNVAKIILGVCLLVFGILMLVLPGQGLITILIGLSLLPFPGKQKMEKNLLSRQSVRSTLNWIRIKAKKEPFIFD